MSEVVHSDTSPVDSQALLVSDTGKQAVAEAALFEHFDAARFRRDAEVIFLLGAPRTGSTILYQAMVERFELAYLSNLTNTCYPTTPAVGIALQRSVMDTLRISFRSAFGKVSGAFQPSEASAVMAHWCGGGHPSQTVSATVLPEREVHMQCTAVVANRLFKTPLAIKNAWNCFRVASLAKVLPQAKFLWIRRDIRRAALSDLCARYATKGRPDAWNSATPSNVEVLRQLPQWAQVVANQYEFNAAIDSALGAIPSTRWTSVWYEDFCRAPGGALQTIGSALLGALPCHALRSGADEVDIVPTTESSYRLPEGESQLLLDYAAENARRLSDMFYPGQGAYGSEQSA